MMPRKNARAVRENKRQRERDRRSLSTGDGQPHGSGDGQREGNRDVTRRLHEDLGDAIQLGTIVNVPAASLSAGDDQPHGSGDGQGDGDRNVRRRLDGGLGDAIQPVTVVNVPAVAVRPTLLPLALRDLREILHLHAHTLSQMSCICEKCGAKKFREETPSLCCQNGKVVLPALHAPHPLLQHLFTSNDGDAKQFRENIRLYNSSLAFASLGANPDITLPPGVFTFRIQGEVHHKIGSLLPDKDDNPKFAQIYIHDNELALRRAWDGGNQLNQQTLLNLQQMMHNVNPFAKQFHFVSEHIKGLSSQNVKMILRADSNKDTRRYNIPTAPEIAVLLPGDDSSLVKPRDIVLYCKRSDDPQLNYNERATRKTKSIHETHPHYDPLHYVLFFPYGEDGWRIGISHSGAGRKQVSTMEYYCYRIMERDHEFNSLLYGGRLFHQYLVDQGAKLEQQRLRFLRSNQSALRTELYQGLSDAVLGGDVEGHTVGQKVILPATYTGSPRNMLQLYQDAMSIVRTYGKPDLFITFTCNPNWPEIFQSLKPNQVPADRPDIIARVFRLKLRSLMDDILKKKVFGKVQAFVRVIEFQKRGLPHCHMLIILENEYKPRTAEDVDRFVQSQLPADERILGQVKTHMLHGPCGTAYTQSPCMKDGKCSKGFPKDFHDKTTITDTSYPLYHRPDNGRTVEKKGALLDNRWVVPYNSFLLLKYQAHINVEVCNSVSAVKYLYKYVYKGHDRVMVQFSTENHSDMTVSHDEIKQYVDARYMSASEACWRIFHFELHDRQPSIQRLALHLPNQQAVVYREGEAEQAINNLKHSTLTAWFEINKTDLNARQFYYHEMPQYYTWDSKSSKWNLRKNKTMSIGRVYSANAAHGERFYLRLLLHHIKGATSFDDLKRMENGNIAETFKQAAIDRGIFETDDEWDFCLQEASSFSMPYRLRQLFCFILVFGDPAQPKQLWTKFEKHLTSDFLFTKFGHNSPQLDDECSYKAMCHIDSILSNYNKSTSDYDLPQVLTHVISNDLDVSHYINNEKEKAFQRIQSLNQDQLNAFHIILQEIDKQEPEHTVFFVDGPGGCGKTFLYNTLLSAIRGKGHTCLAMASSGIASELLEEGRTAHSTLKIPIPIMDNSMCSIKRGSTLAMTIKKAKLVIWDEAPMTDKRVFECVDRSLQDIMEKSQLFGGKIVVLGGDFRQILPVVKHGSEGDIIKASLNRSYLWHSVKQIKLTQNMRAQEEGNFHGWLMSIGNGEQDVVHFPQQICGQHTTINDLIDCIFGHDIEVETPNCAILTTKNDYVDDINDHILSRTIDTRTYLSADSVSKDDNAAHFPVDFLNTINVSGLPPHRLTLKVGVPVMLIRNLNPEEGLLNGTRLAITKLGTRVLEGRILTGRFKGKYIFIPRITLCPSDTDFPFTLHRRQFPIKVCYAMTINKSQGQTLDRVGLYLPSPVFTHGQLYVALSRAKSFSSIHVYTGPTNSTPNVVYRAAL